MNEEASNSLDEVVELSQGLENACRLCLTTEQTRSSIFGVPHVSVPFAEKIRICLAIQITSNDKLPTLVCTTCIQNINHWHLYKDVVSKSQEKLQQWLSKQNTIQPMVTVKEEPVDVEFRDENAQTAANESNMTNHVASGPENVEIENESTTPAVTEIAKAATVETTKKSPEQSSKFNERIDKEYPLEVQIKTEPVDTEDEDDCNIDVESVNSGELLINPMAVAVASNANNDRVMEADSTQKLTRKYVARKKMRRGPHTHFRGARLFKKKCIHCKINLHSKHSYTQHMSRYHGINNLPSNNGAKLQGQFTSGKQKSKLLQHPDNLDPNADTQSKSNPDEVEFEQMIKTDPLTPVQRNIIGQLKTFSCYSCQSVFFDRRHTLNHIRQHMPDLRIYTCIACLTEFADRSMYKLHCGASFECAMKIALVIPKVGNEKYFTCNMCLRSFNNRRELLSHLASHIGKEDRQMTQPSRAPVKLKSILPSPASKNDLTPSKRSPSGIRGPYMHGDPAHNHMCDLCGMIYRYKPNMFKHRDLCSTLPENIRTSYRCVHCNMTYLVYKKFYIHVLNEHKKKEITCFTCSAKFPTPDDYLTHHETHRVISGKENTNEPANEKQQGNDYSMMVDPLNDSHHPMDVSEKPFNCALCGEDFTSKAELTEHRNLHLKVKIYSCVICRSMFSSSGALEIHMKEHGIDDANEQGANSSCVEYGRGNRSQNSLNMSMSATSDPGGHFNHCYLCGKNFSNLANLKRHEKNLHIGQKRRWSCDECKRRFKSLEAYEEHVKTEHGPQPLPSNPEKKVTPAPPLQSNSGKPLMQCPKCPKTFAYQGNLILHCQNVHKENHFERIVASARLPHAAPVRRAIIGVRGGHSCDVCGKTFRMAQSLKTHRGWHLRTNYRLKKDVKDTTASLNDSTLSSPGFTMTPIVSSSPKPAKARKSFPNNPSQKQLDAIPTLQCQVCDDRFHDVADLRKHLWDVHCARNKPEKTFTSELQCELCTNKFQDEDALEEHMKWHSQNPILSGNSNSNSNSDSISSAISAVPERKTFYCDICGKYYSNHKVFLRHKKLHKVLPASSMLNLQSLQSRRHYCHPCQKNFSTEASLRRHKASPCHMSAVRSQIHAPPKKITTTAIVHHPPPDHLKLQTVKKEPGLDYATTSQPSLQAKKRPVTCHICKMIFPNMSVLYQHKQLVHKVPTGFKNKASSQQTECVPLMSAEGTVCCNLCGKQFPGVSNLKQHFAHKHKLKSSTFPCSAQGCKLVFSSISSLKAHETTHSSLIYNCNLCDRHVFSKAAMTKHMLMMHKPIFQSGADKTTLWSETDLTTYNVRNCQSTACPKCKIKYPNLRALKIHYLKFHEST